MPGNQLKTKSMLLLTISVKPTLQLPSLSLGIPSGLLFLFIVHLDLFKIMA